MKKIKKGVCLFLAAAMLLSFLPAFSIGAFAADAGTTPDFAASGSGTEASPYIIETSAQLTSFKDWVNAGGNKEYVYVKLGKDIVVEGEDGWTTWEPIGTVDNYFVGCFDGNGHTVSNINIYSDGVAGLFGYVTDSVIKNLGIKDSEIGYVIGMDTDGMIETEVDSAAIAYSVSNSRVENCYNTADVYGAYAAGIVNSAYRSVIIDCYNEGFIEGETDMGGIAVYTSNSQIINCRNSGCLSGYYMESYVGGIVKEAGKNTKIINCQNTGSLGNTFCHLRVGGIVAETSEDIVIENCSNTGSVGSVLYAGGIIGYVGANPIIKNCTNSGKIYCSDGYLSAPDYYEMEYMPDEILKACCTYDEVLERYVGMGAGAIVGKSWKYGRIIECYSTTKYPLIGYDNGNVMVENSKDHSYYYNQISKNRLVRTCTKCGYVPPKMENITVSDSGYRTTISWDSLGAGWNYYVQFLDQNFRKIKQVNTGNTSCEYRNNDYDMRDVYAIRMYAYKDSANSYAADDADVILLKPEEIDKSKVHGVTASVDEERISVSWDELYGASNYYVYFYENGKQVSVKNAGVRTKISTVDGLTPGVDYTIKVIAKVDGKYQSKDDATEVVGRIKAVKTAIRVGGVWASKDREKIDVSWIGFTGAEGYYVYFYENGKQVTCKNAGTKTRVSVSDALKPGVDYTIKVIAKLNGVYQSKDDATPVTGRIIPKNDGASSGSNCIQNVYASTNETRLNVCWGAVMDAEAYYVYVYENGKQVTCKNAGTNTSISIIDGLTEETDYTVKVIAKVDGKYMSKDDAVAVNGRICAKSPDKVYVTENNPGTVKITWKAIKGANEYYVRVTDDNGYKKVTRTTKTSLTLSGLNAGGKYNVEVAVQIKRPAENGINTYVTLDYGAITEITVAQPVSVLLNAEVNEKSVRVYWEAPEKATTYYVYEKVGDSWKVLITLNNPEKTEINIKNASSGEHTYAIIARLTYNGTNIYTERFISNTITV